MLLRASSELEGKTSNLRAISEGHADAEDVVPHTAELVRFAEAVVHREADAIPEARGRLREAVGAEGLVDAAAVIGNFERMVRIADGTGIPLDTPVNMPFAEERPSRTPSRTLRSSAYARPTTCASQRWRCLRFYRCLFC